MECIIPELTRGSFTDRGETWYFRPVQESDSEMILSYLQDNYSDYNDGEYLEEEDMQHRFDTGFYDNSLVIYDARGTINSMVVYYGYRVTSVMDMETISGSILFIEGERNSVATKFLINYWRQFIDTEFFMYDTTTQFIIDIYKDVYGIDPEPLISDSYAIPRSSIDINQLIKIKEM